MDDQMKLLSTKAANSKAVPPSADDAETPALGVEDIPGAVLEAPPVEAAGGEGTRELRDRLAAFRSRRTGAGATGVANDPIAMGRNILNQLTRRLAEDTSNERKPFRKAVLGITRGYEALEREVEKLRGELNVAHEAVRAVQRQSD